MSSEPTNITIDSTSIINLKAELLRKQEEFRLKKISKSQNLIPSEYESNKTISTWGKKKKTESETEAETKTEEKFVKDNDVAEENEEEIFNKSRKMLESKAKYYEQVASGAKLPEEGDEELFLVDFDQKISEKKEDKSETFEKLKLKTEISEDEFNEQIRLKWEKEAKENLEKSSVHYQDVKFDEIRYLGVGNFQFSRSESERKKQMEFFKDIQSESRANRIENEIYRLKREKVLIERLNKVKQRRLLKHGYSLSEIKEMFNFDQDLEEIDKEIEQLEIKAKNPDLYENESNKVGEGEEIDDFGKLKSKRKVILDREWDKPKLKEKTWEKHIAKLRSERNRQYAPPKEYDTKNLNKKNKIKTKKQKQNFNKSENEKTKPNYDESETANVQREFNEPNQFNMPPPPPSQFFPMPPPYFAYPPMPTPPFFNFAFPPPSPAPQQPTSTSAPSNFDPYFNFSQSNQNT